VLNENEQSADLGPPMRWRNGRFSGLVTLLLILAVIFGLPALISARIPVSLGTDSITTSDPDYVFIGNSMLESRIVTDQITELTDGGVAISLADGGLGAGAWFLRLKNFVLAPGGRPDAVFIFFRDDALTEPNPNPNAEQFADLQQLMGEFEPEYDGIVTANSDLMDDVDRFFDRLYPVQERRSTVTEAIQRVSASTLMPELLSTTVRRGLSIYGFGNFDRATYRAGLSNYEQLKRDTNTVFDRANFRQVDSDVGSNSAPEFDEVVGSSFLPLLLDLGEEYDTRLVFVRVQRRPQADGSIPGSASLDRYIEDLSAYLSAADAGLVDMNGDPDIRLEHYLDTDHITPGYMKRYTEIFFQNALEHFKP
jgi:hypothetical protein